MSETIRLDLAGLKVFVGMPSHRAIDVNTNISLLKSAEACIRRGISLEMHIEDGSSVVTEARNGAADAFLKGKMNRLFWIDSDMQWEPEDFMRLLAWSVELECVGAAYPKKEEPTLFCCMPQLHPGQAMKTNKFGCIEMDGFGLGFTVVQRKVMEDLAAKAPTIIAADRPYKGIFRQEWLKTEKAKEKGVDYEFHGEDITFFSDVKALGYKVWLDPNIRMGHIGKKIYKGTFSDILGPKWEETDGLPNT